jgi:hypothetical protein
MEKKRDTKKKKRKEKAKALPWGKTVSGQTDSVIVAWLF